MNGSLRWIAAAAAVILIAVVGFAVLGRPSDSEVAASPSPTAESSPTSSSATTIPDTLKALWIGETRLLPELSGTQDRSFLDLQRTVAVYQFGGGTTLGSTVAPAGPDRITFTSADVTGGCEKVTSARTPGRSALGAPRSRLWRTAQRPAPRAWAPCPARGRGRHASTRPNSAWVLSRRVPTGRSSSIRLASRPTRQGIRRWNTASCRTPSRAVGRTWPIPR